MSSAWENCAESCNLIFAPTLSGYAREELCSGAPLLFRDAVVRLCERAIESSKALQWRGWALRVLAHRLRPKVKL